MTQMNHYATIGTLHDRDEENRNEKKKTAGECVDPNCGYGTLENQEKSVT